MAGRKRQNGVKRTASGRKSRAADAYQEHADAIATRMRLFGLSEQDARDQKAATFIGRLYLTGALGKRPHADTMYECAVELQRIYEAYQRAVKSPDALRTGSGVGTEGESEGYEAWCRNAIRKQKELRDAITAENSLFEFRGTNMHAAIDYIVYRDQIMWHMVGDCRLALNAAAHHLGMLGKPKRVAIAA